MRALTSPVRCAARRDGGIERRHGRIVRAAGGEDQRIAAFTERAQRLVARRAAPRRPRPSASTARVASRRMPAKPLSSAKAICPAVMGEQEPETTAMRSRGAISVLACLARQQAGGTPIGHQRIFQPLRADREQPLPAMLPDQAAGLRERLVVEHVEGDDARAAGLLAGEAVIALPGLERDEVDEADRDLGLAGEVEPHIRFRHRRDGMAGHHRVAVEPIAGTLDRRRTGCRTPGSGQWPARRRPAGATPRRGSARQARWPCRSSRHAARNRRSSTPCSARSARSAPRAAGTPAADALPSSWGLRARDAGDAQRPEITEARDLLGRRRAEEQHGRHAGEAQHLHHGGGAGVVVAIEGEQPPVGQRSTPACCRPARSCRVGLQALGRGRRGRCA